MQYVGIDWGTRRAAWCSFDDRGDGRRSGVRSADGLARLVHTLGPDAYGCVEMMSGAVWVREQLQSCANRLIRAGGAPAAAGDDHLPGAVIHRGVDGLQARAQPAPRRAA